MKKSGLLMILLVVMVSQAQSRTMQDFESIRSYDGAPPVIPHEINESTERINCLSCHQYGGLAPLLKKSAPRSPHPEYSQCLQCHVPQKTKNTFKGMVNEFVRFTNKPVVSPKTLPSAPPVIPHGPQYRTQCQTCHVGSGAVSGLKSNHPERQNCLQCHVWQNQKERLIIK